MAVLARYWDPIETDSVQCSLCPHQCVMRPGATGRCGVRTNAGGELTLPFHGRLSAVHLDPIEKKPLYHFHPGKQVFSIGFLGCNLTCPFCQNYQISQSTAAKTTHRSPGEIVQEAVDSGSFAIAYTYNEPSIHVEYVLECCTLARRAGLNNVLVSNGHLLAEPAAELLFSLDAANIDLKSFSPEFYTKELGGRIEPVLEFLRLASQRCHLEVTTLLIPGKNDSADEIESIARFVATLGDETPLHISAYYPTYRYSVPATHVDQVAQALEIARHSLKYVYAGNTQSDGSTYCPECSQLLVSRHGYSTQVVGLKQHGDAVHCTSCETAIPVKL